MCGKKSRSSLTCMCKSNRLCFINSALRPCFVAKCFKGGQASVMKFTLDMPEQIARARSDLRMGVPIVLQTAEHSMLAIAVETLDEARLEMMRTSPDAPHVVITARRAQTLKTAAYDGDLARIALPQDAPAAWVHALADPSHDLSSPMKGPLRAQRGGDTQAHRLALRLLKDARLLPAAVTVPVSQGDDISMLTTLNVAQATARLGDSTQLAPVVHAALPMQASTAGRVHVFRPDDGAEEHYAIEIGRVDRSAPVLTRLHSACFTGDVLGSMKCDCGPQLHAAMAQMGTQGAGILLYLNQEGRGIGLANKMRAYALQDQGFDTVEANHRLGFEDDERDFRIGSALLRKLGVTAVRLLTNNPAKIAMMEKTGVSVAERVPLQVGKNPLNEAYLATKSHKSGHML